MTLALAEVARAVGCPPPMSDAIVHGWSIDSRTAAAGDLFFALRGPQHDGHAYVAAVLSRGAAAAIVEQPVEAEGVQLHVGDTLAAMQSLASWARSHWHGTMIGVTGSAGKTTTKDVIAHLLSTQLTVGKTSGNFNNHVGAPLSLLRIPDGSSAAVLELGMNHRGEIQALAAIVKPVIGVVTNVGYAHIENFESLDEIAAAKRELIDALPATGLAVLNADDPKVRAFGEHFAGRVTTFGIAAEADVRAENIEYHAEGVRFSATGVGRVESSLLGRAGVSNILAGLAVAREFGISSAQLRDAIASLPSGKMRGERLVRNGITIFNDCYNSNPDAARAMLDALREAPAARRIAVLGEMLELGRWAETLHREVGRYAAEAGITVLMGIRGAASHMVNAAREAGLAEDAAYFFDDPATAGRFLKSIAQPGDAILFKGSRGTRVELALESFLQ